MNSGSSSLAVELASMALDVLQSTVSMATQIVSIKSQHY